MIAALLLSTALAAPVDWRAGLDPEMVRQANADASEIVSGIRERVHRETFGDDRFRPWGYATGLALMLAGEFLLPGPKPVARGPMFARVSSLGHLQYAWPSPISVLGVLFFAFSLRTCGAREGTER